MHEPLDKFQFIEQAANSVIPSGAKRNRGKKTGDGFGYAL